MPIHRAPKKNLEKLPPVIILRKIAYGPAGFTCHCGSQDFEQEPRAGKYEPRNPRSRCAKCKESYIFVPLFASPGGTIF